MQLDMEKITNDYKNSKGWREFKKYAFAIGTFGLGGLYLWATTSIIKQGEIGLRRNSRGEMILLPPGRHSNFPWETYPVKPQSLSQDKINLAPYTIIRVQTGNIAETYNNGILEILGQGLHLLEHVNHVFTNFISIKQETKKLNSINAITADNVSLALHADVRYEIEDPNLAITMIDDMDESIKEISMSTISQIVSQHAFSDFIPVTNIEEGKNSNMSHIIGEFTTRIAEQWSKLGIKLLSIGVTSWEINSKSLAESLAQAAVANAKMQVTTNEAKQQAEVTKINAQAAADALKITADSQALAKQIEADRILSIANSFTSNPYAMAIYTQNQEINLVAAAKNAHLFFNQSTNSQKLPITLTIPTTTNAENQTELNLINYVGS